MADEGFLGRLSGPAFLVFISFHLLFLPTSQSFFFAKAETLEMRSENADLQMKVAVIYFLESGFHVAPPYTNVTCSRIPSGQNCMKNGRPDTGYLHWKWKPFDCDLPQIDAATFLNAMRHKSLLYIGESLMGNQVQSMLCILSQVEEVTLVYHDKETQFYRYYFPTYNFTVGRAWSPFLVASPTKTWTKNMIKKIFLDVLDESWTKEYTEYDYIYFTGGRWFTGEVTVFENQSLIGCTECPDKGINLLDTEYIYSKALQLTYNFMVNSDHKPLVIYRAWVPSHDRKSCKKTQPFKEGEYKISKLDTMMRRVEIEEFAEGLESGLHVKHLDVYYLSLLRPDAHPGPYKNFQPDFGESTSSDCLHWCLPGLPETWNQLLMAIILGESNLRSA